MPSVSFEAAGVTAVHEFFLDPPEQAQVVALLSALTGEVLCRLSGFHWASVQQCRDDSQVLLLSHWRSQRDWERMLRQAEVRLRMRDVLDLAREEVHLFEVAGVWGPWVPKAA